jgi:hypothetical protein
MRNMRPPLKKKDSVPGDKVSTNNLGLGVSFADDKKESFVNPSNALGLSLIEESFQPTRSMNVGRRGSIDNKSEKNVDTNLTLIG